MPIVCHRKQTIINLFKCRLRFVISFCHFSKWCEKLYFTLDALYLLDYLHKICHVLLQLNCESVTYCSMKTQEKTKTEKNIYEIMKCEVFARLISMCAMHYVVELPWKPYLVITLFTEMGFSNTVCVICELNDGFVTPHNGFYRAIKFNIRIGNANEKITFSCSEKHFANGIKPNIF